MNNSLEAQALARQSERPDIHFPVKFKKGKEDVDSVAAVTGMVFDLKETLPDLSSRLISRLVGVSDWTVRKILDTSEPEELDSWSDNWTSDDNEASAASELAALRLHHPGREYEDCTTYTLFDGRESDSDENCYVPFLFTAPSLHDPYRVADQSHASRRPITLPQFPFIPLPERQAA